MWESVNGSRGVAKSNTAKNLWPQIYADERGSENKLPGLPSSPKLKIAELKLAELKIAQIEKPEIEKQIPVNHRGHTAKNLWPQIYADDRGSENKLPGCQVAETEDRRI